MNKNKKAVAQHKDLILQCLDDPDITIRMRALDLITSMVNEKNLEVIIQRLTDHLYGTDGNYRDHVLEQIILVCKKHDYEFVRDFAWYVQLLTNMTGLSSMCKSNAELVSSQLMDVTIRVPEVREFSVQQMEGIIVNNGLISDAHNMQSNAICRILEASAYIVGEYSLFVKEDLTLVSAMLQSRISSLPGDIQCIFIHNALKVVCSGLNKNMDNDEDLINGTIQLLEPLSTSSFIEVQERANSYLFFMKWLNSQCESTPKNKKDIILSFSTLFISELMPLHPNSQQVIAEKIPSGLNLDEWFFDEPPQSDSSLSDIDDQKFDDWYDHDDDDDDDEDDDHDDDDSDKDSDDEDDIFKKHSKSKHHGHGSKKKVSKKMKEKIEKDKLLREQRQQGVFYIHNDGEDDNDDDDDVEHRKTKKKKKKSKKRKKKDFKLTDDDINSAETKIIDDNSKIEVYPNPNKMKKIRVIKSSLPKNIKYTVKKTGKTGKNDKKSKKSKKSKERNNENDDNDKNNKDDYINPLTQTIDWSAPKEEMPSLKPYEQITAASAPLTITTTTSTEKKEDDKGEKKKKSKKDKKREKREKKKAKKEKKRAKKAEKKKQKKEKKEEKTQETAEDDLIGDLLGNNTSSTTKKQKPEENDDDDLLGDLFGSNKKETKKSSKSSSSNKGGDDFLDGLLGGINSSSSNGQHHKEEKQRDDDDIKEKKHKKKDKKSKKSKKNKQLNGIINEEPNAKQILFEDDNVKISYFAYPSNKKSSSNIDVLFITENISPSTIKSVKISFSKSSSFKTTNKEKTSFSLGKKLTLRSENRTKIELKCKNYDGEQDELKCKISYDSFKSDYILLKFATHTFIRNELISNEEINDENSFMNFKENHCKYTAKDRIKLASSRSIADSLDMFVKIWRVHNVSCSDKKVTYYGNLMLNKYLAIYIKTNKDKNAIQISISSQEQSFSDSMLKEIKTILLS